MKKQNEPKIKLSFDGCYNYKKLKEEGLVEDTQTPDEEWIKNQTTGGSAESVSYTQLTLPTKA